jgi:hypothetical protein
MPLFILPFYNTFPYHAILCYDAMMSDFRCVCFVLDHIVFVRLSVSL